MPGKSSNDILSCEIELICHDLRYRGLIRKERSILLNIFKIVIINYSTQQFEMLGDKKFSNYLMKSSIPFYAFIITSFVHKIINMHLKLPAIAIFDIFALFPLLDLLLSQDWVNPTLKQIKQLEHSKRFLVPLYLGLILDWSMTIKYFRDFFTFTLFNQVIGYILLSMLFASTFLIAHELMHRNSKIATFIATLHQVKCLYMHFTISHIYGHHKQVATPLDPSSAQKGESVYKFVPRSIIGSYQQAFSIKPKEVSFYTMCYALYISIIYFVFDFSRVIIALAAAFGGVFLLECINYIEHYGLRRKQLPDGTYQKVNIKHSWNAPHRLSNYLLFKLQRHSDHHENSQKPYQTLCSYQQSPQLPEGYLGCLTMCLLPSKWYQIMDPLVDEYMNSQKSLKGTQLECLPEVQRKVKTFSRQRLVFFGIIVVINLIIRLNQL